MSYDTGAFCYYSHQLFKPLKEPEQRIAAHGQRTDTYALHRAAYTDDTVRQDILLPRKAKDFVLFSGRISIKHALMGKSLPLPSPV